ncbi:MAG: hypothetical protein JXA15_13145 [Spirochaetales bacterium]|nr:hypothetical protein [Spirochaetales bacterium]
MNFSEKLKHFVDQGLDASRDFLSKAGDKAQQWGEMGVLKVEILQLRSEAGKLTTKLGARAYEVLAERAEPVLSGSDAETRELLDKLAELDGRIEEREAKFRGLGGKDEDLSAKD